MGNSKTIGAYRIGEIELTNNEVATSELQEFLVYSPPQSFLFLSHGAKNVIDRLCQFSPDPGPERKAIE